MALVVAEHRHPGHVDVLRRSLDDRIADHHPMFFPCLAQSLVHVLDGHQQPVLQFGRVELLQRRAVRHEAVHRLGVAARPQHRARHRTGRHAVAAHLDAADPHRA